MPVPFDSHAYARALDTAAARHGWVRGELPPVDGYRRPWVRRPSALKQPLRVYLSAGIHGDEPAGCRAALRLLARVDWFRGCEVYCFPLINPVGLARGTRENGAGIDLNRDYNHPRSQEVPGHLTVLDTLPACHLHIHLHEDWESAGAYFYELCEPGHPAAAEEVLAALARHVPIEEAEVIDGWPARGGVIARAELPVRDDWPEPLYLAHRHGGRYFGYTLETPSSHALPHRVAAQVEAVRTLLDFARTNRLAFRTD